jgi:phosphoribosylformimino-5-aminoimidazole carboxamide ribotide isomerase
MKILAAIDLRGGGAVRLLKGVYEDETSYGDPHELAAGFVAEGTDWLHLVDLDAARDGGRANRDIVLAIARDFGVPVETGGGIRSMADVEELIEGGISRVILGTAALDGSGLLEEAAAAYPGMVAVGLDYRRTTEGSLEVAVRGWLEGSGYSLSDAVARVTEVELSALVVTAIDRDGTLEGPDLAGLEEVLSLTSTPVVASAGVSNLADVVELAALRSSNAGRSLEGSVIGKALVEGRLSVSEAVRACR